MGGRWVSRFSINCARFSAFAFFACGGPESDRLSDEQQALNTNTRAPVLGFDGVVVAADPTLSLPTIRPLADQITEVIAGDPTRVVSQGTVAGSSMVSMALGTLQVTLNQGDILPVVCDFLDFDADANRNALLAGADLQNAYQRFGVGLRTWNKGYSIEGRGISFDSAHPTGGDSDLGTPNEIYGGPGIGTGGETNEFALGNLLIKANDVTDSNSDGLVDVPNDDEAGAWFQFTFDGPRCVSGLTLVGADEPARVQYCDSSGAEFGAGDIGSGLGTNSVERVALNTCNASMLWLRLGGGGGLDDLRICDGPDLATDADLSLEMDLVDQIHFTLEVQANHADYGWTTISTESFSIDPFDAVNAGVPNLSAAGELRTGDYSGVRFTVIDSSVTYFGGATESLGIDSQKTSPAAFTLEDCGQTDVHVDWTFNVRIGSNLDRMGVGIEYNTTTVTQDTAGCPG